MVSICYNPPKLDGHKIIYKGKRFWIFEISKRYPFYGLEISFDVLIFDKTTGPGIEGVIGCARKNSMGFSGELAFGQERYEISGL